MIKVMNVTKQYGNVKAVDDISFEISDGEIVGLLGPNGAGKTTTMNMLTGYIEITRGSIEINGYDVFTNSKMAKKQIGYMPENVPLYMDLKVKEFLRYMAELKLTDKKEINKNIEKVMKDINIEDVKDKIIRNLSKGYRQRVSLAGTLVSNPKVIILDEPMSGLDPKQILEIRDVIKNLKKEHTTIISSHILSEINQVCDKVIIINKGKIIAIDTPKNLEESVKKENIIFIKIEDTENKIDELKKEINNIEKLVLESEENGIKNYKVQFIDNKDYRKELSYALSKLGIAILEIKQQENTLEDAFMKILKEDGGNK